DKLPIVIVSGLFGLLLLFRGRLWAAKIVGTLRQHQARGLGIWRFIISLLRILFPLAGLWLISIAAGQSGYLGVRGMEVAQLLPVLGLVVFGFRWVSERVFARDDEEALLLLPDGQRKRARLLVNAITIVMIISIITDAVVDFDDPSAATRAVIEFPFTLLISLALYRIGKILHGYFEPSEEPTDTDVATKSTTYSRIVRSLGIGAIIVSVLAPVLFAIGYQNLSDAILRPYVTTLVLLGIIVALQRFLADVYGAITGQGTAARDALMPVFFGLILILIATPLLALIWGARVADLTELWSSFSQGFTIGGSRISPTNLLTFAIIFSVGYLVTRLLQGTLRNNVLPKTQIDIGGQNALLSGLGYVGIFLAALVAITGAGIDLSSLAIVAGALSVGIGFGLQNIVSNFVSGIILLIERPISEGDWIEVGGKSGYVRDISVRSTRIETFDRTDVIVPNADLISGTVTNFTRGNTVGRVLIPVGVAYGTDTKRVEAILREIAEAQPMVLANPAPNVLFLNFGADALEFEIRAFLRDVNWMMAVKSDINHAIAARFTEENIEVPFAQRDVWLRNPEALKVRNEE
ncbi:MAG: mechanosensitive ion channel family protein, partial [Sulfitobacter sp. SK025]